MLRLLPIAPCRMLCVSMVALRGPSPGPRGLHSEGPALAPAAPPAPVLPVLSQLAERACLGACACRWSRKCGHEQSNSMHALHDMP